MRQVGNRKSGVKVGTFCLFVSQSPDFYSRLSVPYYLSFILLFRTNWVKKPKKSDSTQRFSPNVRNLRLRGLQPAHTLWLVYIDEGTGANGGDLLFFFVLKCCNECERIECLCLLPRLRPHMQKKTSIHRHRLASSPLSMCCAAGTSLTRRCLINHDHSCGRAAEGGLKVTKQVRIHRPRNAC